MKKILFVGAEAMPFAATGGLGDVLGSLPASVQAEMKDADVRLVMPLYSAISDTWRKKMKKVAEYFGNQLNEKIYFFSFYIIMENRRESKG